MASGNDDDSSLDLVTELAESHPEPTVTGAGVLDEIAAAINGGADVSTSTPAASTSAQPMPSTVPNLMSRKGERYDQSLHEFPPQQTARGGWKKLRKPKPSTVDGDGADDDDDGADPASSTVTMAAAVDSATPIATGVHAQAVADEHIEEFFGLVAPMLDVIAKPGDESWQPSTVERVRIRRHLTRFYQAHPNWCVDLPPGWALVFAVGAYAMPRVLMLPAVQSLIAPLLAGIGLSAPQTPSIVDSSGDGVDGPTVDVERKAA